MNQGISGKTAPNLKQGNPTRSRTAPPITRAKTANGEETPKEKEIAITALAIVTPRKRPKWKSRMSLIIDLASHTL
jgi:hypothetical protein